VDDKRIKETLNLPRTSFSMKAKLAEKEPDFLKKWEDIGLYGQILEARKDSPPFVLHDGPPYANGHIHLGTALNKILKDFIVRSRTMAGFKVVYVPGWDCHGLPIEIKVDQTLGDRKRDMSIIQVREECKRYALDFVDIQRAEFRRLGGIGAWDQPYLTLNPEYEGEIIRYLAAFFASGSVYKGKKPVYWCNSCRTALAEAEIEYKDHASPSVYVKFPVVSDLSKKIPALEGKPVSVLIWTTTPWTLPANLGIAFHPDFEYAAFETRGEVLIAARKLVPVLTEALDLGETRILATFPGRELEGLKARHPFINRESVFVLADYVTLDQGTGAVHTAPGHGHEDYLTGLKYGLDIYTPVDGEGRFTSDVERYAGMDVFESNAVIVEDMAREGHLLKSERIVHSYPHCWRCKKPVIFRATAQWFISMEGDGLRNKALEEIKRVNWIPPWGEERISNMMVARPDWCISRQRSWGVPIPAFSCRECGEVQADETIALHVADIFSREGSNAWFMRTAEELLPPDRKCSACGSSRLEKENNILDVWFESGASQNVLGKREDLPWPADVYIEGHDQYRGWFNSSLLVGVAARGASPYKTCITHGFVLDEQGRAMSKSIGNVISPQTIIEQNGAEILRLWVAMLNFREDARYGEETRQRLVEAYRKLRNTWRFMLGNITDFNPDKDSLALEDMELFDRWILERFRLVGRRIVKAYDDYEYHVVFHTISHFFTVDLSATYLDVIKDRLYCSPAGSNLRKSAQTALFRMLRETLSLMAPILPFTCDEAWNALPDFRDRSNSVHLELFSDFQSACLEDEAFGEWQALNELREKVLKELESARESKLIGNSLEAVVTLKAPAGIRGLLERNLDQLASLLIVSTVDIEETSGELGISIARAPWEKCRRCWNYSKSVGESAEQPRLCERCRDAIRELEK
jgi:isoleucyl-tRNA synthetase